MLRLPVGHNLRQLFGSESRRTDDRILGIFNGLHEEKSMITDLRELDVIEPVTVREGSMVSEDGPWCGCGEVDERGGAGDVASGGRADIAVPQVAAGSFQAVGRIDVRAG